MDAYFFVQFGGRDLQGEEVTAEVIRKQMTEHEWTRIYEMSQDKALYQNLISSLFPTIHGQWLPWQLLIRGGVKLLTDDIIPFR